MRGTLSSRIRLRVSCGIIPAGAGHFISRLFVPVYIWDHPRRCGALGEHLITWSADAGSSPQVRGTYSYKAVNRQGQGIIPAGAGHLNPLVRRCIQLWDHPRRCGALIEKRKNEHQQIGSSPQVRGTWVNIGRLIRIAGIIPAGAGHFAISLLPGSRISDHPRRCGALPT